MTRYQKAKKDEAYEIWCSEFAAQRGIPYQQGKKGDFVQLSHLREDLGLKGKVTPDRWLEAIHNYFKTPQGRYTLADLCCRFDVFMRGPLDRYNKPVEEKRPTPKIDYSWLDEPEENSQ